MQSFHNPRRRILPLALILALPWCAAAGETTSPAAGGKPLPSQLEGLRQRWLDNMDRFGVSGFAVAAVNADGIVYLDTFGYRDAARTKPVTPDTYFYIASCTKTYTAAGVMTLVDAGKLKLDDPVKKWLPRLELPDSKLTEALTVRDLLCHRHGISKGGIVFLDAYTGDITDDRFYELLKTAEIAAATEYTNVHFTIAGRVIQAASGQEWRAYLREHLFQPAGLTRTTGFADAMYADPDVAEPVMWNGTTWAAVKQRKTDRTMHAAGGLGASIRDMAEWVRLHLNRGQVNERQIISSSALDEMLTQQSERTPEGEIRRWTGFGLGWQFGTYRGRPFRGHGGGYVGAGAFLYFLPEENVGVVVATNASGPAAGFIDGIVSIDVLDRMLGITGEDDLLPGYVRMAERWTERQRATANEPPPAPLAPGRGLTLPLSAYVGEFESPLWGTLHVRTEGDALALAVGDMALDLTANGENQFVRTDDESATGKFVLSGERVTAVEIQGDEGVMVFARRGR